MQARKRGLTYERRVLQKVEDLFGYRVDKQVPLNGGYADALVYGDVLVLVECKSSYTWGAWAQLRRYARDPRFGNPALPPPAQVVVCREFRPSQPVPEASRFLRLNEFPSILPGELIIIPWSGRT